MTSIVAFDVGVTNFAVRAEFITNDQVVPMFFEVIDFGTGKSNTDLMCSISEFLKTKAWDLFDYILIEGQLGYVGAHQASAIKNVKIQQHLESYFMLLHPNTKVVIVPSKNKYPKELTGKKKYLRKKWGVVRIKEIFTERGDVDSLEKMNGRKADDLADTELLILAFLHHNAGKVNRSMEPLMSQSSLEILRELPQKLK